LIAGRVHAAEQHLRLRHPDLPIGQGDVNAPVALGTRHRLDAHTGTLQPLEAATA